MALSRERKEELVAQYTELLENANGFVVVTSSGLTVKQTQDLRTRIRDANGQYIRAKNTLFQIALQNAGWDVPEELVQGPISIAFSSDNFPGVAKAILDYLGDRSAAVEDKAQVTGGILADTLLKPERVEAISKLPSMDELRAEIAGLLVQPSTGLVSILNSATGQVVNVLQAYVNQSEADDAA